MRLKFQGLNSAALRNWLLFIVLAIIWGSSFILIKEGIAFLTPFQAASVRIVAAGAVLLPLAIRYFRSIPVSKLPLVAASGALGSLFPAYLFCLAEEGMDSAMAGTLNSLTPIFVIITGALFFGLRTHKYKVIGILVAFGGTALLSFNSEQSGNPVRFLNIFYIIIATIMYGLNVNLVQRYLKGMQSLHIVSAALVINAIPALVVLGMTGYFSELPGNEGMWRSTLFSFLLGFLGTAVASILFYMLIKRAGAVFSSMVTYGIPIVANIWGIIYGENMGMVEILSLMVILTGVYLANRKWSTEPPASSAEKDNDRKK